MGALTLSLEQLDTFAAASHDFNPLHVAEEYARRTPFGQRVVHGVLAALAALGHIRPRPGGESLEKVTLEFARPVFAGVSYEVEVAESSAARVTVRLRDGAQAVLRVVATFRAGGAAPLMAAGPAVAPHREPVEWRAGQLVPGTSFRGEYAPSRRELEALLERFALRDRGISAWHVAALMACSYVIGMELPGRDALFARLALTFAGDAEVPPSASLACDASVQCNDERFDLLDVGVVFNAGAHTATGKLGAFVRRPPVELDPARFAGLLPGADALAGRVAVVVGGGRGIGAALAVALTRVGCAVTATCARDEARARALVPHVADSAGSLDVVRSDASDLAACLELRTRVLARYGRVDLLVLCATPPVLPLDVTPGAFARVREFVASSLAMAAAPLAAFVEPLAAAGGRVVLLSSAFVRTTPPEWPHYVAAKSAAEGLAQTAAAANPTIGLLLARPPRVLTDLTNTVRGHEGALPAEHVAAAIVRALVGRGGLPTGVTVLEDFSSEGAAA